MKNNVKIILAAFYLTLTTEPLLAAANHPRQQDAEQHDAHSAQKHSPQLNSEQQPLALHCGKMIDIDRRKIQQNITIIVQQGKITSLGNAIAVPSGAKEINLRDHYCAPGLIDTHTHLATANENGIVNYNNMTSASKTLLALRNAQTMLDMGFTTLRIPGDMDHHFGIIDLRDAIAAGDFMGPRLLVAPHLLTPTSGHNDHRYLPSDLDQHVSSYVVKAGEHNAREAVRGQIRGGADWIKITASGGVMSEGDDPSVQSFTDGEIRAFAEETHRYGKKITAHIHSDDAAYSAAKAKFDSIEHGTLITDRTIKEMKKSGTYLIPTLYVVEWIIKQGVRDGITEEMLQKAIAVKEKHNIAFKKAYKAGLNIAFGTDQIFNHRESLNEFKSLIAQGVSNWDAIAMATANGARLLAMENQIGSLAVGKFADIIAMPGNPADDITAFEDVSFVLKAGRIVRQ
jgi:imidazolonepropionase-like amidohydrolase